MFIYYWEIETEHEQGRGRQRGRHRIRSRLQALSCQHRAWRGARTHEPKIMTWAAVRCLTNWATQVPPSNLFKVFSKSSLFTLSRPSLFLVAAKWPHSRLWAVLLSYFHRLQETLQLCKICSFTLWTYLHWICIIILDVAANHKGVDG